MANITIHQLTADNSPILEDELALYDVTEGATKKTTIENLKDIILDGSGQGDYTEAISRATDIEEEKVSIIDAIELNPEIEGTLNNRILNLEEENVFLKSQIEINYDENLLRKNLLPSDAIIEGKDIILTEDTSSTSLTIYAENGRALFSSSEETSTSGEYVLNQDNKLIFSNAVSVIFSGCPIDSNTSLILREVNGEVVATDTGEEVHVDLEANTEYEVAISFRSGYTYQDVWFAPMIRLDDGINNEPYIPYIVNNINIQNKLSQLVNKETIQEERISSIEDRVSQVEDRQVIESDTILLENIAASSYEDININFGVSFSMEPNIISSLSSNSSVIENMKVININITQAGFTLRCYNNSSSTQSANITWIAAGIK